MKIAHVTATFPPYMGGAGNVCYYNVLELNRRGHEVHVYTGAVDQAPAEESIEGVQVHRLKPVLQIGNAPLLPGLVDLHGFDLIHLHYPFIFGAEMVRLISIWHNIPYVMTHHNDLIGNGGRRFIFNFYNLITARIVAEGARKWMAVSRDHALSSRLAKYYLKRESDLFEIPNGVDTVAFQRKSSGTSIRQSYNISENDPVILFVGVLSRSHHYRRVDFLLQAVHDLQNRAVHCLIAGDGDLKAEYQRFARDLGLEKQVHFLGRIDHRELPNVYAAADMVVLPSTIQESFGMVLIEAMACEKPVIGSRLPGVRTVVRDGVDGYLVEPGQIADLVEKLGWLLKDPVRRAEMGRRGREKVVEKYAWPKVVDRLEEVYVGVLTDMHSRQTGEAGSQSVDSDKIYNS